MKKLFLILLIPFFAGCKICSLAQIPPQILYADDKCTAVLPDYKLKVTVTSGCSGYTLTQTPLPGHVLTYQNKSIPVTLKALSGNMKSSSITFWVNMIDTITPKIVPSQELTDLFMEKINEIYNAGDKMVHEFDKDSAYFKNALITYSIDSAGFRKRVITYALDSLSFNFIKYTYE